MGKGNVIFILGIAVAVLLFWNMSQCKSNSGLISAVKASQEEVKVYETKNNELVYYNNAIVLEGNQLKSFNDSLSDELKNMKIKNPEVVVVTKTITRIDTVSYVFRDTLPCSDFTEWVMIDSTWYSLDITVTKDSLTINDIYIPNETTLVVGEKKNGIFKKNEYVFAIKNSNPYISQEEIEPYVIKEKGKILKDGLKVGIGVALGILLSKLLSK